jgi:hypothetical protein
MMMEARVISMAKAVAVLSQWAAMAHARSERNRRAAARVLAT